VASLYLLIDAIAGFIILVLGIIALAQWFFDQEKEGLPFVGIGLLLFGSAVLSLVSSATNE